MGFMNFRLATDYDESAWDAYVLSHPEGLAYHQFAWKRAIEEAYGFEGLYLLAEQDNLICGVFPMVDFKVNLLGRSLISLPYCDAGGPLADFPGTVSALLNEAGKMRDSLMAKALEVRFGYARGSITGNQIPEKVRMTLDLPENSEALLKSFKSKLRSQVRKSLRNGLTAKLGGLELVEEFYAVFSKNMRELGSPVHSLKWICSVVSAYGRRAKVGLVYSPDENPIAGGIILLHRETVSIPWASSLRDFNRLNPNMLLYWTFLAFAADNNFSKFDFGRSTPEEGTYRFKEQWGAKPEPLVWKKISSSGEVEGPASRAPGLRRIVEKAWTCMPLGLCNFFGPALRRNISL
jgi:FemAB-related protein (PEP-CTERM system-associated)